MLRALILALALLPTSLFAQEAPSPSGPKVELTFKQGVVILELYPQQAPKTVENFLDYVRSGFYNNTSMHRLVHDMLLQGGGYDGGFKKKVARGPIPSESNNGLSNLRGTIAMARKAGDANSATSEFFINLVDNPSFNYFDSNSSYRMGYTVFGRVSKGMEVIDQIRKTPTSASGNFRSGFPKQSIVILKARVLE
jgi:peptidyl-prolyl cis-trans isomerase A (cyclophilin A)